MGRPGKFEGIPDDRVAEVEALYAETPDSSAGESAYGIWRGLFMDELIILSEDNVGFVDMEEFDTLDELMARWKDIEAEEASPEQEMEDG